MTEERLRHQLDANQPAREGLCLALLPLLGPFSQEQPRRPKGGPDGGRDIEAVFRGSITVWAGVGFRNGGGNDETARKDADEKFRSDLARMLKEKPSPRGFVFFTNVDLTPAHKDDLIAHAKSCGMEHAEVFDFERLRNILDSAEGLIARLQYLSIPMTATEQAALAAKYGADIQRAVATRFDRVDRALEEMEDFLAFQKPIFQIGLYVELREPASGIDGEAFAFAVSGLRQLNESMNFLCVWHEEETRLLASVHSWFPGALFGEDGEEDDTKHHGLVAHADTQNSIGTSRLASFAFLTLNRVGSLARLIDLLALRLEVLCTDSVFAAVARVMVDANGYELFNVAPGDGKLMAVPPIPAETRYDGSVQRWRSLVRFEQRMVLTSPLRRSPRFVRD
ncbi:MAG TPA: hypothetical protein VGM90_07155 [Kofleriaceae bacterium]